MIKTMMTTTKAMQTPTTIHIQVEDFLLVPVGNAVGVVVFVVAGSFSETMAAPVMVLPMAFSKSFWLNLTTPNKAVAGKTSSLKPAGI